MQRSSHNNSIHEINRSITTLSRQWAVFYQKVLARPLIRGVPEAFSPLSGIAISIPTIHTDEFNPTIVKTWYRLYIALI